jgi:WD40 repeat protein
VYEVPTGKPLGKGFASGPGVMAISPDGSVVAAAVFDGKKAIVRRWDPATGDEVGEPLAHEDSILGVRYTPDGTTLVTVGKQDSRLWEAKTGKPVGKPLRHDPTFDWRTATGVGTRVVQFQPTGFSTRDIATGELLYPPVTAPGVLPGGANIPPPFDGVTLVTADPQPMLSIRDAVTDRPFGRPIRSIPEPRGGRPGFGGTKASLKLLSPDRRVFLTAGDGNTVVLYDLATGEPIGRPLQHPQAPTAALFSPDSNLVVTACFAPPW